MSQFDNVSVVKKGNVFFDGKCVSHSVLFSDGTRKTVGVIMPSTLTFNVSTPELMEITSGTCRVKIGDEPEFRDLCCRQPVLRLQPTAASLSRRTR